MNEQPIYAFPKNSYGASSITFNVDDKLVMRITADKITANPEVEVDEAARAVLDALQGYLPKSEGMSWQPIETAPKDGTTIDLWDSYYGHRVTNARRAYHYWENGKPIREKSWGRNDTDGPFVGNPTHWMPLPKPPER